MVGSFFLKRVYPKKHSRKAALKFGTCPAQVAGGARAKAELSNCYMTTSSAARVTRFQPRLAPIPTFNFLMKLNIK